MDPVVTWTKIKIRILNNDTLPSWKFGELQGPDRAKVS